MKDPSTLKVVELKEELRKRGLKVSGLKRELIQRLSEHISKESPSNDDVQIEASEYKEPPVSSTKPTVVDDILRDKKAFSPAKNRKKNNM
jgi:Fe2+ or Zn2+ uptake regulation protein